jgi:hypothetical protein
MNDLALIETEVLLNEVFNRFDSMVVIGVQNRTTTKTDSYYRRWSGGDATCIGLLELLKAIIKNDYLKEMEDR